MTQHGANHSVLEVFFTASEVALELVRRPAVAQGWETASSLEGFTAGALTTHLYWTIHLFEEALEAPAPSPTTHRVVGLYDFYGLNRIESPEQLDDDFNAAIRAHAASESEQGPVSIASAFATTMARLRQRLPGQELNRLVPVWRVDRGATMLSTYLRTRVVELAIHTDDLAVSVGAHLELPNEVVDVTLGVLLELARARHGDLAVLRALCRRERSDPETLRVL